MHDPVTLQLHVFGETADGVQVSTDSEARRVAWLPKSMIEMAPPADRDGPRPVTLPRRLAETRGLM